MPEHADHDHSPDRNDDEASSCDPIGRLLIADRQQVEAAECRWMLLLAEFDGRDGWRVDGHLSTLSWLKERCGLSQAAASERLRVARAMRNRPVLVEAFASGEITYSKMRPLTRIPATDEETDRALVEAARLNTAAAMEGVYREWLEGVHEKTPPPKEPWEQRGMRVYRRIDGMVVAELVLTADQAERLERAVDEYLRWIARTAPRPDDADEASPSGSDSSAEESEPDDCGGTAGAEAALLPLPPTWRQRRADALVDLIEETMARLAQQGDDGTGISNDRVSMSVIVDYEVLAHRAGRSEISGGTPLRGDAARRLACDAGIHRIIVKGQSEILDVGRETRQWNRAQRRAILFRHGGRCAVKGCDRRVVEIHHVDWWTKGGATDLELGVPLCYGHHRLVHEGGWSIAYDAAAATTVLEGPQGQRLVNIGARPTRWPMVA